MSTSGSTATDGYFASTCGDASVPPISIERHQAKPVTTAISATPATIAGATARLARGNCTPSSAASSSTMPPGVISYDQASVATIGSPITARIVSTVIHHSGRRSGSKVTSATCSMIHMPSR